MKSKQLANVLIKILGISLILHAMPSFFTGLFSELFGFYSGLAPSATRSSGSSYSMIYPMASGLAAIVSIAIAIVLIFKSRKIAEYLFSDDE
jgi:ABC-type dipeptide/oligopeptide/nickel transport system permease component